MKDKKLRYFIRENMIINHLNILKLYIRVLLLHGNIDSVTASILILSIDKLMKNNKYLNHITKLWLSSDLQDLYFEFIFEIIKSLVNKSNYDEIEFPHNPSKFIQFVGHKDKKDKKTTSLESVLKFLRVNHILIVVGYLFLYKNINELVEVFKYTTEKYKSIYVSNNSERDNVGEVEQIFIQINDSLKHLEKLNYLIPVKSNSLHNNYSENFFEDLENSLFMSYTLKFKYVFADSNIIFLFEIYKYLINIERIIFSLLSLQNVDKNFSNSISILVSNQILNQINFLKTNLLIRNEELDNDETILYTIKSLVITTKRIFILLDNINDSMARKVGLEPTT